MDVALVVMGGDATHEMIDSTQTRGEEGARGREDVTGVR